MVLGQILSHKRLVELANKPEEKDQYLMRLLGISDRRLRYVRASFSSSVKVSPFGIPVFKSQASFEANSLYRAAKILGEIDPKSITEMNLAALAFSDWDNPEDLAKKVHYQLKKLYNAERKEFLDEFGFKLPYIEFLRQQVVARELNCLKDREKYKNFEVSREDIQRNISLPDLDYESCLLLAGYWGRGFLDLKGRYKLEIGGGKDDFDFYENWLKDVIRKLHNLEVKVESIPIEGYEAKIPRISITSRMIASWLSYDLGFPRPKKKVNLPNIYWNEERKQGFFDGIIAFMGGSLGRYGDIALHDSDLHFIENLRTLANELGYNPKTILERGFGGKSTSYRLYFSPKEVKKLRLINPKHRKEENCRENSGICSR